MGQTGELRYAQVPGNILVRVFGVLRYALVILTMKLVPQLSKVLGGTMLMWSPIMPLQTDRHTYRHRHRHMHTHATIR